MKTSKILEVDSYIEKDKHCYGLVTFCYDMYLDVLGDYPVDINDKLEIKETFVLKYYAAQKFPLTQKPNLSPFLMAEVNSHPIPIKLVKLFERYYQPNKKIILLDIAVSQVPINIAVEEGCLGGEGEARCVDWYTANTFEKYRIKSKDFWVFFMNKFNEIEDREDFDVFANFIFPKTVSLQQSVFIPQFELRDLFMPLEFIIDDSRNKSKKDWNCRDSYLDGLNRIRGNLGDNNDAFSNFLINAFNSIKCKLEKDNLVMECNNCGNLSPYVDRKKYCSDSCRKRAESKRYYKKHAPRLRKLKKADMQDTRRFYKEHNIEK